MGGPQRTLGHIPFFDALAASSESSPQWRELTAGLVTLRLVDAWLNEGPSIVSSRAPMLVAVREAIEAVERRHSVRQLLTSVVDAMQSSATPSFAVLAPRLMAYARSLQFDAWWSLAADVYDTVLAHAPGLQDAEVLVSANMNLGRCRRMEADWASALTAYRAAGNVAALSGDMPNSLRARVGEANVARDRGNLPLAEQLLDDTIAQAGEMGLTEMRAIGLHERAVVAHRRGDCELAVRLGYEALQGASRAWRDFVLSDLAAFFFDLGVRSAARDAHLILAATAQEQYTRWQSTINLIEIAAIDRSEPTFELYRRELANAQLPASLASYYHLYVAKGYMQFGKVDDAKAELRRAIAIASTGKLNQLLIMAEQELETIDQGVVIIAQRPEAEPSEWTAPAVEAIRAELALVTAGRNSSW